MAEPALVLRGLLPLPSSSSSFFPLSHLPPSSLLPMEFLGVGGLEPLEPPFPHAGSSPESVYTW